MEPNFNFDQDQDNATLDNNTSETAAPRVIRISQTELAALRGQGYNRAAIANYYGITAQELYQVMVGFGMVKARTEKENLPSYIIEPVADMPVLVTSEDAQVTA